MKIGLLIDRVTKISTAVSFIKTLANCDSSESKTKTKVHFPKSMPSEYTKEDPKIKSVLKIESVMMKV